MRSIAISCSVIGVLFMTALGLSSEPVENAPEKPVDAASREKWQKVYREIAESLEMRHGETRLELHDVPLLYYTNPVRTTDQHGTLFLWTERGQPAVLGSIWSAIDRQRADLRNIAHEYHSLVEDADVHASVKGEARWSSGEAGIAWKVLDGAPKPGKTRPARLVQMRELARRLSASITTKEEKNELRLMPQPLYRYPENVDGAVDGSLFVFALATDPELIVLIKQPADADDPVWKVAFARFGNLAMEVKDRDRTLWTCERGIPGRSAGRYLLKWKVEQRSADLETESSNPAKQN
jgi:hypothetical protein